MGEHGQGVSSSCGLVDNEAGQHQVHTKPLNMGMGCWDSAGKPSLALW